MKNRCKSIIAYLYSKKNEDCFFYSWDNELCADRYIKIKDFKYDRQSAILYYSDNFYERGNINA